MATRQDEKARPIDFVDLIHVMNYIEEHYGGVPELHISTDEDDKTDALLCITCPRGCKLHPNAVGVAFASRKIPYQALHRVQTVFYDMLHEIIGELDGACPACLAYLYRHN